MNSPMSYFLHYLMRLRPERASSALVFGAAVDAGLNFLLTAKRDGQLEPHADGYNPVGAYLAHAKVVFDETLIHVDPRTVSYSKADHDMSVLTQEDLLKSAADPSIPMEHLCLLRKGSMILDAYAEQVLPKLEKVLLVQREVSLTNELGDSLIGIVDLVAQIEGKVYILDNKTSSVKYSEDSASISQQLATYFEALKDEYKLDGVGYIVIPKNIRKKKEPRVPIEIKYGVVDNKILGETFDMYENVLDGIKSGDFRCTRNCCKQPWPCPYKNYCDSNGRDLSGLKYEVKKGNL